jgi:cytochrome P450
MAVSESVLRPGPGIFGQWFLDRGLAILPFIFAILRNRRPILRVGRLYLITLHDDVRAVFTADDAFVTPYREKLSVITGGEPFILGLADGPEYRSALVALRSVVRRNDQPMLAARVSSLADAIVKDAPGRIDIVDTLVRRIAFDFIAEYLGVASPANGDLRMWATRLFEYQFVSDDAPLRAEVTKLAPAMRDHVQGEIERCRAAPAGRDDLIARCLTQQARGVPGFDDAQIRTAIVGLLVGGPPQPPMVIPQAFEQLLRRPTALAAAQAAAHADDDTALAAHLLEAMRFDPLAPWMPRVAATSRTIGTGTDARVIPQGAKLLVSIASAMRDPRRVPEPTHFDASRSPDQYLHFGFGMHQCFGLEINLATLHLMVKPLLKRSNLRRASGSVGHLRKRGAFASSLLVTFD